MGRGGFLTTPPLKGLNGNVRRGFDIVEVEGLWDGSRGIALWEVGR